MKKTLLVAVGLLGVFFCIPNTSYAERIADFSVDVTVQKNADVLVVEKIEYDFEDQQRRGIFRTIPLSNADGSRLEIGKISVVNEKNIPYEFTQEYGEKETTIKIGNAQTTITGKKTYIITYTATSALVAFDAYDELYWNVTGSDWKVPIDRATVKIFFEAGNDPVVQSSCYQGRPGSTQACSESVKNQFTAIGLKPGQGLTVAVGFEKNNAGPISRIGGQINSFENKNTKNNPLLAGLSVFGALGAIVIALWFRSGNRDPKSTRPVVAWYEPSHGLAPVVLGTLIDTTTDMKDVVAQIISLAERGYISIMRSEEKQLVLFKRVDYQFTITQETSDLASALDTSALRLLFGNEYPALGMQAMMSDLEQRTADAQLILKNFRDLTGAELVHKGYFEPKKNQWVHNLVQVLLVGLAYVGFHIGKMGTSLGFVLIPAGIIGALIMIVPKSKRTQLGVDTTQEVRGFKEFLSVTDKERFDFHNAPEKNPTQFMKFLPYAIAFGVEEKWAKQFENMVLPEPTWYHGNSGGVFVATDFARDMKTLGSGIVHAATPASSGSGGGGSSGGGSGGGGGGSW